MAHLHILLDVSVRIISYAWRVVFKYLTITFTIIIINIIIISVIIVIILFCLLFLWVVCVHAWIILNFNNCFFYFFFVIYVLCSQSMLGKHAIMFVLMLVNVSE